ncbi:GNAT family N-acetyltransferase [Curvivirga aplysinae]|uniref:GNAT family N-acetyltransferase n=1 Tax=Curvivirga aplysinae TaxID=2529852 RepID=UPI0012BC70DC|nr:GNAT family protein [Curvivirga aplysinae]MTI09416.1 N-acetyltransferase [Curvivirga aplysinae]
MSNVNYNEIGQILGVPVPDWKGALAPDGRPLHGQYCYMEKLDIDTHCSGLFEAFSKNENGSNWTYLPVGPFETEADFRGWLEIGCVNPDPFFYVIRRQSDDLILGMASYLRIDPTMGSIEVGHIHFSPLMQRTPASTECMYMMMKHAFEDLGHRRYEWKCNNLNEPSKKAAERLGFSFEGVFRQMSVIKGHNRDTAWFSILNREWKKAKEGFETWLSPDNFDANGKQKSSLQTK